MLKAAITDITFFNFLFKQCYVIKTVDFSGIQTQIAKGRERTLTTWPVPRPKYTHYVWSTLFRCIAFLHTYLLACKVYVFTHSGNKKSSLFTKMNKETKTLRSCIVQSNCRKSCFSGAKQLKFWARCVWVCVCVYAREREREGERMWKAFLACCGLLNGHTMPWNDDVCGQSYNQFTLVNYDFRVVIWGIFKSGTTLES